MTPDRSSLFFDATVLREPFSGVEVAVYELACALARLTSYPLTVHLPSNLQRPVPESSQTQWTRSMLPFGARLSRIAWQHLVLPARLAKSACALLHAPAYVAPWMLPCPLVLTLYDLHVYSHPQTCKLSNRIHYRTVMPRSIHKAAAIIVPSNHTLKHLRKHFGETIASKAEIIPLGVSPAFRHVTDPVRLEQVRKRHRLPERFILFVGNLAPRKNLPLLFAAWRMARVARPDLDLVLAGQDEGTEQIPGDPGLHKLGYVPSSTLPAIYTLARALIFPSIDEGYGLPGLEAMACGCPVICAGGAPAEIAPRAILSPPALPEALSGAILNLLNSDSLRNSMSERGLAAAGERTWSHTARSTLALYARVAGDPEIARAGA